MSDRYRGWVPTVNGRLSFRLVGETNYPTAAEYSNVRIGAHQYVVVRQPRNLSDVLFPTLLSRLFGVDGDWDFFLVARSRLENSSPNAKLIGRLYLFRTLSANRGAIQQPLREMFSRYREIEREPFDAQQVRLLYANTQNLLSTHCEIRANIVLRRNGAITLSNIIWSNSTERENSLEHSQSVHLDIDDVIADQLYFFVRDVVHKHQHHSPDADTLITLHKAKGNNLDWCNNIIYSLWFHIITMKRRGDSSEHVRALGVLAYIETFQEVASQLGCNSLPLFFSENARKSIEASRAYIELTLARHRQNTERARIIAFAIVGTALTIIGLVIGFSNEEAKVDSYMLSLANMLKKSAWVIFIPLVLAAMYYAIKVVLYRGRRNIRRDIVRTMMYSRAYSVLITIAIAAVIFLLFLYFMRRAVVPLIG